MVRAMKARLLVRSAETVSPLYFCPESETLARPTGLGTSFGRSFARPSGNGRVERTSCHRSALLCDRTSPTRAPKPTPTRTEVREENATHPLWGWWQLIASAPPSRAPNTLPPKTPRWADSSLPL